MANKVQRIGFIGISGRGSSMLDLLLQVDGVKVPAVCDLIVERAEKGIDSKIAMKDISSIPFPFLDGMLF